MGVEDGDEWRDAQKPRGSATGHEMPVAERSPASTAIRGAFGIVVFWLCLGGALYAGFTYWETGKKAVRAPYATAAGDMVIPRGADGHFRLPGTVNGHAVEFLVDTGASLVTVSDGFARRVGLDAGQIVTFNTANGPMQGRVVQGVAITAGHLAMDRVVVGVGLDTGHESRALLGQNFLSRFDIELKAREMVLRLRQAG